MRSQSHPRVPRAFAQITIDLSNLHTVHCSLFIVHYDLSFVLCALSIGATRAFAQITIDLCSLRTAHCSLLIVGMWH